MLVELEINLWVLNKQPMCLEKGTWIFAAIIAVLCITSSLFLTGSNDSNPNMIKDINTNQTQQPATPANQTPAPAPSQQPGK
jgi:preprotein translocase subunit SecG